MHKNTLIFVVLAIFGLFLTRTAQDMAWEQMKKRDTISYKINSVINEDKSDTLTVVTATALAVIGYLALIVGCGLQAAVKGRSRLWGILGLLSPVGLVFMAVLKEKNQQQE